MKIRYIRHKDIDFKKWDNSIERSASPLIYAYSWYLDCITDNQWDALIYGDYEAIYPLPWKKKYFLKYVYQPFFCQQLGLFATQQTHLSNLDFIKVIPKKFILIDQQLNLYSGTKNMEGRLRDNFQLNLHLPYDALYKNYSQDVKNNLKKIEKSAIKYLWGIPYQQVMAINRNAWGDLNPGIKEQHYQQFGKVCSAASERGKLQTIGAFINDELIGAALLFKTSKYLFYVISGKTETGKKNGVMNGIVDEIIKINAGKNLVLDFEGSEIKGVAYFYKKFGSTNVPYLHFKKYNRF